MITLEDLAREAGVSHSTVSRALANSPLVNPKTRDRIQILAKESGYQVNQVARNLKTQSTKTIGLVVPEVSNPYYPLLIQEIADRICDEGYNLHLRLSGKNQDAEPSCISSLYENRADGILVVTGDAGLVGRDEVKVVSSKTPVVVMGWVENGDQFDLVTGDDAAGGRELANHLISLGHTRIATLGKAAHRGEHDRLHGFEQTLLGSEMPIDSDYQVLATADSEVESGVNHLLGLKNPPTAIFAYQDSLAALVYKHLFDAGISIPRDMTVVGFDNLDIATYLLPRLTTVGNHIKPLAYAFVDLLMQRIRNKDTQKSPEMVVIKPELVVRSSSDIPRTTGLPMFSQTNF